MSIRIEISLLMLEDCLDINSICQIEGNFHSVYLGCLTAEQVNLFQHVRLSVLHFPIVIVLEKKDIGKMGHCILYLFC